MVSEAEELYASRGKKIHHLDLKNEPASEEEVLKLVLGPTGNLRAPALKSGKTLIIGFHPEVYADLFE